MRNHCKTLADLDYQILRFLRFSDEVARGAGLDARQHALMVAVKGLPAGVRPTVSEIAERLQVRYATAIGLVNHLAARRFIVRDRGTWDRREVILRITPSGNRVLRGFATSNISGLRKYGLPLANALSRAGALRKSAATDD